MLIIAVDAVFVNFQVTYLYVGRFTSLAENHEGLIFNALHKFDHCFLEEIFLESVTPVVIFWKEKVNRVRLMLRTQWTKS